MQPQSPDPRFDFMLKDQPKPGRSFGLPALSKPVKIILGAVFAIFLLIIISSVISGHKGGATKQITAVLARGQEVLRVTQQVQQLRLQDPTTQALAATVNATLSSDQQQLLAYLSTNHVKVSKVQLAADTDKSTDTNMQSASQNNSLDSAYDGYLKDNLNKYQTDLQAAYGAAGPKGKVILKNALEGTTTLLSNPPLKS